MAGLRMIDKDDELFNKLREKLDYLNNEQIEKIYSAYIAARDAHFGQKRVSGDIYISHPIEVASILADMHMDAESIMASLLHDVIEDTTLDKAVVEQKFGKAVAEIVDGVTKLSRMQFSSTAEAQAESFRKMVLAMAQDIRVILVKLADRLHNMRTMESLPPHKTIRIAKETLEIYAPIANRLGIYDLYVALENLCFLNLYPNRYKVLQKSVKQARGNRKEIVGKIEEAIRAKFRESSMPSVQISGREKQVYSIYKKMERKHLSFSEIMDVYGFRIIVDNVDDCYRALGVVHSLYKPIPGKFKDYIAIPKVNGYKSLHTTLFGPHGIPIEIQIRTLEMEQMASKGIAAHWLYKSDEKVDDAHIRAQQWINNLLELQQKTGSSLEFVENVKIDLFPEAIYLFTPKGKILELPRGATAVDFAYAVHTDIGNSCVSARIDHYLLPLSTELFSGQTVTIISAAGARPNPAWLNFVKTAKARSAIRHYLKQQKHSEAITLGKQLLTNALESLGINFGSVSEKIIERVAKTIKAETPDDLFADIGLGNRLALLVARQLADYLKEEPSEMSAEGAKTVEENPLLIKGAEGMVVHFATCCCPVPGDSIIACVSTGRGLIVHAAHCKNVGRLQDSSEKCVLVRWADDVKGDFLTIIHVEMSSRRGAFAALTSAIADTDASIEDIIINKRTGEHYSTTLKLLVRNKDHLQRVLHRITNLDIVTKVSRA
jgi:guanosine-3',5'-bis(diphosphate) 3'-pyrophosphohydrolase